ncbi:HTH-type transcriptional regulator/antitoxin HigA [Chitinophaga niastensis]|uniref:HTH-type transcriptional regulator/antitoxin HigA n=1 Tax=Chitinophaga niastensis TaxID=536980 RepID=A0A2P8HN47_CHINA|nr:helix-turn-helix domain-containing protein [Chitinophaga niastensis]PSL47620.1 HTH-type transcriptional regulator/antitoxin HigA [Chitinophaga niastensis]
MNPLISTEKEYTAAMQRIHLLMKKGEANLSAKELKELQHLSVAAERFEDARYPLPKPTTLSGMIELKMFEMKLKQKEMAIMLDIGEAKFSQILNGKREPDVDFLRKIYRRLKIDAEFILQHV